MIADVLKAGNRAAVLLTGDTDPVLRELPRGNITRECDEGLEGG